MAGLQTVAEELARKGRFGDSMLLHVNPIEVTGLDALAREMYGTGLTVNPDTGQPEAFLPFLAPLMAALAPAAGTVAAPALAGTAAAAAPAAAGLTAAAAPAAAGLTAAAAPAAAGTAAAMPAATTALQSGIAAGMNAGATGATGAAGAAGATGAAGGLTGGATAAAPMAPSAGYASSTMPGLQAAEIGTQTMAPAATSSTTPMLPMSDAATTMSSGSSAAPTASMMPKAPVSTPSTMFQNGAKVPFERVGGSGPGNFLGKIGEGVGGILNDPMKMIQYGLMGSIAENYLKNDDKADADAKAERERKRYEQRISDNYAAAGRTPPFSFADGGLAMGPGDGRSDSIPAMIDGKQRAEISTGEFIFPADVVSAIGRGSTEAGAARLEEMMMNIRANRDKLLGAARKK